MLASPFLPAVPFSSTGPQNTSEDSLSFRPARDVDAFNNLLPPPIEFVEGSSSGALAIPEGKYQPINVSPKLSAKDVRVVIYSICCQILHHCYSRGTTELVPNTSLLSHPWPLSPSPWLSLRRRPPKIHRPRSPESTWRGQRHATVQLVYITLGTLVF